MIEHTPPRRSRVTGHRTKMRHMSIYITYPQADRLQALARAQGLPWVELLRRAIDQYLAAQPSVTPAEVPHG